MTPCWPSQPGASRRSSDPRVLRERPDRARLPRGRGAARARAVHRGDRDGAADRALPRRRERRPVGRGLRGSPTWPSAAGADDHRRGRRRSRAVGGGARAAAEPRDDRPGQPVYALTDAPEPAEDGPAAATLEDLDRLVPACAAAHEEEIGIDPLARDPDGFRWRTRRRSRTAARGSGGGRHDPLQGGGVGLDAVGRAAPAGLGRPGGAGQGYARAALADLCRLLLERGRPCASSSARRTRRAPRSTSGSACDGRSATEPLLF